MDDKIEFKFNNTKEKIDSLSKFLNQKEELIKNKITDRAILEKILSFNLKYSKFKNINRFCIPIIGECNSGKTTFMNFLLQEKELLDMNGDINTRFICIIRHDSNLPLPKIYSTNLTTRDSIFYKDGDEKGNYENFLYNFEEGDEIKVANIKNYIKEKNEILKNGSNELNNYFLILRINIPFFNKPEYAPYANLFDLMDIPGLNDNNEIYLKKLFPSFVYNIKFCFFIFDSTQYHNSIETFSNVKSLFKENENNIINNSIFILNKYDKPEDKELANKSFNSFINDTLKLENIEYIPLSSEQLLLNLFKYENFLNYTEYIFKQPPDNNVQRASEHIRLNLEKDFNINIDENIDDPDDFVASDESQNIEYKIYEQKMKNITNFDTILNISDYFYYKKYFKSVIRIKSDEIKLIEEDLFSKILDSLQNSFDFFIDFKDFEDLMDKILKNLGLEDKKINEIKKIKTIVKNKDIISLKNSLLKY